MTTVLLVASAPVTLQGIPFSQGDYLVYEPSAQVATPYIDSDSPNPLPFTLPRVVLDSMISQGSLCPVP